WSQPVPIGKWAPSTIKATETPPACPQSACNVNDILCPKVYIPNFHMKLGILGFLATGTGPDDLKGNYGILDQQLAIHWVKSNIDAFGGDPNKITLFGQSTGAQSTTIHYLRHEMQPFFRAAIIQSCPVAIPFRTYVQYITPTILLVQQLNYTLDGISCFRASSYHDIVAAQNVINSKITSLQFLQFFEPWLPVIDNIIVGGQLMDMFSSTSFLLKPLIIGTMNEEALGYVYGELTQPLSPLGYLTVGPILFGSNFSAIAMRYPPEGSGDQRPLLARLVTQWVFACPTRVLAHKAAAYSYVFGYPLRTTGIINAGICEARACHGYELPFLFQAFWLNFTNADRYISQTLATYWTNYAKSKNPNHPVKVPLAWSKLASQSEKYLNFTDPVQITTNYLMNDCNFWDGIGY
ncbi:unnamed protein product, partial [Rotaria sp. Silwood2]